MGLLSRSFGVNYTHSDGGIMSKKFTAGDMIREIQPMSPDEFDGVAFLFDGNDYSPDGKFEIWTVMFLHAPEGEEFSQKKDLGYKYTICTRRGDQEEYETYDAILGDPVGFANTCMKSRQVGVLAKKSIWSDNMITKFMEASRA
jgi:hypothetical protein